MIAPYLRRIAVVAALLVPLAAACGDDSDVQTATSSSSSTTSSGGGAGGGAPVDVKVKKGCNPLSPSDACFLPYPSPFNEIADTTSKVTGVREHLNPDLLPKRNGTTPLDVTPFNTADGSSPVVPILVHFGFDVDLSNAPGIDSVETSTKDSSPIALFDMTTGKRILFFAEMDVNKVDGFDNRYALIIRPMEPMEMGHKVAIVLTDALKKADGTAIEPSLAFTSIRDKTLSNSDDLEAMRPGLEDAVDFLDAHGYSRAHQVLAWSIQIASSDYLLGSVLSMRTTAFSMLGTAGLPYTITKVTDNPSEDTLRIVEGDFEVPTFLKDDLTFDYDADHHPKVQATNKKYPFTMVIPKMALNGPLPLLVIGHGIFGDGRDFLEGAGDGTRIQQLINQYGVIAIATDWIGLSHNDESVVASKVVTNIDNLNVVTDQLQQALINTLTMTKLARRQLVNDPMIKVSATNDLLESRVFYWGASLGGIEGSSFFSLSDEISRAGFGVPGSAWGTMLSRSIVFTPLKAVLEPSYPDPLDIQTLISLFQARFDHADPANITTLMFQHPLADAPPDRMVTLQESIGDAQVPNIATEILAHAVGVSQMTPAFHQIAGIEQVSSPSSKSVIAQFRLPAYDMPLPPETNMPPPSDNGVHHDMNFELSANEQLTELFYQGDLVQFCQDTCDPE